MPNGDDRPAAPEPRGDDRAADRALVARLVDGDERAWEEFVVGYQPVVAGCVRYFGIPDADVDGACLDVFAKLFEDDCRRLRAWDGRASLRTYLRAIAANLARDVAVAAGIRRRRHADLEAVDGRGPAAGAAVRRALGPRANAEMAQLREMILECLFRMDLGADREILLFHYHAGCDAATIARLSGRTRNAVDQALLRARRHLREVADRLHPRLLEFLDEYDDG